MGSLVTVEGNKITSTITELAGMIVSLIRLVATSIALAISRSKLVEKSPATFSMIKLNLILTTIAVILPLGPVLLLEEKDADDKDPVDEEDEEKFDGKQTDVS